MKDNKKYRIGKVYISATNPQDAEEFITENALNGGGGYICVSNLRMIRYAGKSSDYVKLMDGALMCLPDGRPLKWCARLWGLKDVETTNGPTFFMSILSNGDSRLKHYLLGDTQDVINRIIEKNRQELHANIVGAESLPFIDVDEFDYESIANRVAESGANIIWTAMRSPKQDVFNQRITKHLPKVVSLGVGRAFRLLVGEIKDAPKWAHRAGVAGIFTRKVSLWKTLQWYFESSFYLLWYFLQICLWRFKGKKCYE